MKTQLLLLLALVASSTACVTGTHTYHTETVVHETQGPSEDYYESDDVYVEEHDTVVVRDEPRTVIVHDHGHPRTVIVHEHDRPVRTRTVVHEPPRRSHTVHDRPEHKKTKRTRKTKKTVVHHPPQHTHATHHPPANTHRPTHEAPPANTHRPTHEAPPRKNVVHQPTRQTKTRHETPNHRPTTETKHVVHERPSPQHRDVRSRPTIPHQQKPADATRPKGHGTYNPNSSSNTPRSSHNGHDDNSHRESSVDYGRRVPKSSRRSPSRGSDTRVPTRRPVQQNTHPAPRTTNHRDKGSVGRNRDRDTHTTPAHEVPPRGQGASDARRRDAVMGSHRNERPKSAKRGKSKKSSKGSGKDDDDKSSKKKGSSRGRSSR